MQFLIQLILIRTILSKLCITETMFGLNIFIADFLQGEERSERRSVKGILLVSDALLPLVHSVFQEFVFHVSQLVDDFYVNRAKKKDDEEH